MGRVRRVGYRSVLVSQCWFRVIRRCAVSRDELVAIVMVLDMLEEAVLDLRQRVLPLLEGLSQSDGVVGYDSGVPL